MSTAHMERLAVGIDEVIVGARRLALKRAVVDRLRESIAAVGLLNPIVVRPGSDGYTLVAGLHRLTACQELGWREIAATVAADDDLTTQLVELDENLMRQELTAQERGLLLADRKRVYLELHPETKRGAQGAGREGKGIRRRTETDRMSFADDAAQKIGLTDRSVRRDVQIGEKITSEAHAVIAGTELADRKLELLALTHVPPEHQVTVAEKIVNGDAKTVAGAVRQVEQAEVESILDQIPDPGDAHRRAKIKSAYSRAVLQVMQGFMTIDPSITLDVLDHDARTDLTRFIRSLRARLDEWEEPRLSGLRLVDH